MEVCERLHQHLEDGAYDDCTDAELLAYALTTHMQEVSQDKHLWVRYYPDPLPDHEGSLLQNREKVEELKQKARLDNYGIHKVERLSGNVGYIDIIYFYRTSWGSGDAIASAMSLLANMGAVIIDLRHCTGGHPGTVALVSSYFFGEEPVHLNSLYWREGGITEQYWTLAHLPGERMVNQPVYILTSQDTFSAGEEFTYNLQALQRALVIGEITAGGAHPGSPYRLHPHFEVFIPNGRAINPITNTNWEGSGVQPDITIPGELALEAAYRAVLESMLDRADLPTSGTEQALLEEAQSALVTIMDI